MSGDLPPFCHMPSYHTKRTTLPLPLVIDIMFVWISVGRWSPLSRVGRSVDNIKKDLGERGCGNKKCLMIVFSGEL
jgi:hypothetical protein